MEEQKEEAERDSGPEDPRESFRGAGGGRLVEVTARQKKEKKERKTERVVVLEGLLLLLLLFLFLSCAQTSVRE